MNVGTNPNHPAPLTLEGHEILCPPLPYDIAARVGQATDNVQLQQFVNRATYLKDQGRKRVCDDVFGDRYNAMRILAGQIKQHTLDHLDHYLDQFIGEARSSGAQVHFASTGEEANAICMDISKRNRCRLCVKSKSMVTEETNLVSALEGIGVETVETDLGEFIIQLDHDAPSHIVTPMIHKDRTMVARAFQRELGARYTEDASELTNIARDHLRGKFRRADLGISGANFLVAQSGSIVICTNEGNGRLCTSVPRIHVAVVGIEKLLPRLEDLSVLLKLLARSSTGQLLTVYTHVVTGPRRADEHGGPEQVHIILVDNGRTEILRPETREMLRCIRCGACLNACPVYRKIGGHSYGAVYSGPIGALITPLFKGLANYKDLPHASSLCGACYEACPVHINIPKYLIQLREMMNTQGCTTFSDRMFHRVWGLSLRYPLTFRFGGWIQKMAFRRAAARQGSLDASEQRDRFVGRGWVQRLSGRFGGWTSERDMPTPTAGSFRQWWQRRSEDTNKHGNRPKPTASSRQRKTNHQQSMPHSQ